MNWNKLNVTLTTGCWFFCLPLAFAAAKVTEPAKSPTNAATTTKASTPATGNPQLAAVPPGKGVNCEIKILGTDVMQFQTEDGKKLEEITAPKSCGSFKVHLVHNGKLPIQAMGHNFIVAEAKNVPDITNESIKLGPQPGGDTHKGYTPKVGDFGGKVLAASNKLIGTGESDTIIVDMTKFTVGSEYRFFCTFPGHSAMMQGAFKVTP